MVKKQKMKYILILSIIFICGCGEMYPKEKIVLHEFENIGMPEEYRRLTGYDSIQVIFYQKGGGLGNGWEGHFCYPNQWEFNKFIRIDATNSIIDSAYKYRNLSDAALKDKDRELAVFYKGMSEAYFSCQSIVYPKDKNQ